MGDSGTDIYDVLIIGAGPAGISAAIWCAELGLSYKLLEKGPTVGGQLLQTHLPISNYPGFSKVSSAELLARFESQTDHTASMLNVSLEEFSPHPIRVALSDGIQFTSRAAVIATGVRRRELGVPGEQQFRGLGILSSGAQDPESARDRRVVIIGGGDAAVENALILAPFAERVSIIHRGAALSARNDLVSALAGATNINILLETVVTEFLGADVLRSIGIRNTISGIVSSLDADLALVRIGVRPNSDMFASHLEADQTGYLIVDGTSLTSIDGIYAIGDVANPVSPTIATAIGTGATAIKAAYAWLKQTKQV